MRDASLNVAVVEDDRSVRDMLAAVLRHEGYDVEVFGAAEDALDFLEAREPDLLILDVGLPGMTGTELCATVRDRAYTTPILMLTARHEVADRVAGLDAGADDYLVKPFALDELLARVRATLRRMPVRSRTAASNIRIADCEIDLTTRVAVRGERPLDLTKREFDLLHLLMRHSPAVLTREVIHDRIWGYDSEHMSNSLEVVVSQLRRKMEHGGEIRLLHTVRGVGYVVRS